MSLVVIRTPVRLVQLQLNVSSAHLIAYAVEDILMMEKIKFVQNVATPVWDVTVQQLAVNAPH